MSVYKKFSPSDYAIVPFNAHKQYDFNSASAASNKITWFKTKWTSESIGNYSSGSISGSHDRADVINTIKYNQLDHLFYRNFKLDVNNKLGNNHYIRQVRDLYEEATIISIPTGLYGYKIKPKSFSLKFPKVSGSNVTLVDDGEGNLFQDGTKVGDIIYQHGMAILTSVSSSVSSSTSGGTYGTSLYGTGTYGVVSNFSYGFLGNLISGSNATCSFQSTMTIYESQYKCTFNPNEFNYTQNPSAISSSSNSGVVYDFLTGSYFEPYITTVGLYNEANELVAIGKLAQPLQSSNTTDTTILVNLDL